MSKQLNYIISATLLLFTAAGLFIFIKKIPVNTKGSSPETIIQTQSKESQPSMSDAAMHGKALFMSKCASCHSLFKNTTGPALAGLEDRHKWANRSELYKWIKSPATYMQADPYTRSLKEQYGSMMTAFGDNITNKEIDDIVEYIRSAQKPAAVPGGLPSI